MTAQTYDPIKPWFDALEEMGEYIGIRFGRVAPGKTEPEWFFIKHTECDGIGGFADILRKRGAEYGRLPQVKHPAPPSRLALARILPKLLLPKYYVKWGDLPRGTKLENINQPPPAVAWHVFSEVETTQVRRVCRKMGVTVNSFLLKHLSKSVRPFLEDESSMIPWMVPVNLRGKVVRARDTANFSTYVGVRVQSYESVYDIHRNIYAALGRGEQWANWYGYESGRFTTMGMRKFLINHDMAMSQWNLGSFSNLGVWDEEKKIKLADCQGGWLFAPPVLRCQMIGAGCVTFQNRLSLTIQAHPDLTTDSSGLREWLKNWIKEIEIDVDSVLAEPTSATRFFNP
jgi:hypothetical protein